MKNREFEEKAVEIVVKGFSDMAEKLENNDSKVILAGTANIYAEIYALFNKMHKEKKKVEEESDFISTNVCISFPQEKDMEDIKFVTTYENYVENEDERIKNIIRESEHKLGYSLPYDKKLIEVTRIEGKPLERLYTISEKVEVRNPDGTRTEEMREKIMRAVITYHHA